jgi:hypothetical protein
MGYPLWDMLDDLAMARGLRGAGSDSDARYLRGRVAAVLWIPGLALALIAGGFTGSWVVGVAVLIGMVFVMALVAWGPRRVVAFARKRLGRT